MTEPWYLAAIGTTVVLGLSMWFYMRSSGLAHSYALRKQQRATEKSEFIAAYHDVALDLMRREPLACYYNERANKKLTPHFSRVFDRLPKLCWLRHGEQQLKMETLLAVKWAAEFAYQRAVLLATALAALERAPNYHSAATTDALDVKRQSYYGLPTRIVGELLYEWVRPRAIYSRTEAKIG
jgi:hypothetical protein